MINRSLPWLMACLWLLFGVTTTRAEPILSSGGINLQANTDWATQGAWVNVLNQFRRWGDYDEPWEEASFTQGYAEQGIPLGDSGSVASMDGGYPTGVYQLSYEGSANVSLSGRFTLVDGSRQTVAGVTTAQYSFDASGGSSATLRIAGNRLDDPVRNLKLIAPGYDLNTTKVFRDEFVRKLQPFDTLRFMDWAETNDSLAASWAARRPAGDLLQTRDLTDAQTAARGGVAWEHMITLSNQASRDAWINIPHLADDDYVRNLARLWRDGLSPDLKVIVEFSNELWNGNFQQHHDVRPPEGRLYYNAVAPRILTISQIFKEEFAGQLDRLEVVLAGQAANDFHVDRALDYFVDQGYAPSEVVDAIAIAPYFSGGNPSVATLDELFAEIDEDLTNDVPLRIADHKAWADAYGLKLYAYEGGQHLLPVSEGALTEAEDEVLKLLAQSDPRMRDAYLRYAELWADLGGDRFVFFNLNGLSSTHGYWGALEDLQDPGSVKWDAILSLLLPAGDATLDGTIGPEDVAAVEASWGQSGRFWEQGDFNADGWVDDADLQLLWQNWSGKGIVGLIPNEVHEFDQSHSVPEPGAAVLLLAGATVLLAARRRRLA